jgi:hypothetical protein
VKELEVYLQVFSFSFLFFFFFSLFRLLLCIASLPSTCIPPELTVGTGVTVHTANFYLYLSLSWLAVGLDEFGDWQVGSL